MTIATLPTPPSTASPTTFAAEMDAFLAALPTFVTQANALAATMTAVAAGGAVSLQYTFDAGTTDTDPGAGKLRLDNATQNTATVARLNTTGADGSLLSGVIDTFVLSTSAPKGFLTLRKATDSTKWLIFSVTALASPAGYRNVSLTPLASSAASPFVATDPVLVDFTPTGNKGDTGAQGPTGMPVIATVTLTAQAALPNYHYILTNVAATTVTLPAAPASGDTVWITPDNGLTTNVVNFNGKDHQNVTWATDPTMTLDNSQPTYAFRFVNNKWRFV